MIPHNIDDLLTLLALIIFVDKRVFPVEMDTFMREAKNLQSDLRLEPKLTEASLLSWFESRREYLRQQVDAPDFEAWIAPLLERLKPLENKTQILDVMHAIALSDGEMHKTEIDLITIAAHHWNIIYRPAKPEPKITAL